MKLTDIRQMHKVCTHLKIDLSKASYMRVYDEQFFRDYIAVIDNHFVNLCMVTDKNLYRYLALDAVNNYFKEHPSSVFKTSDAYFFNFDGDTWFYETIAIEQTNYIETGMPLDELKQLWDITDQLNNEIANVKLSDIINCGNNEFFKQYSIDEMQQLYPSSTAYLGANQMCLNYADFEKSFELSRIHNNQLSGLQSFLGSPPIHAKTVSLLYSTFMDTDAEIKDKLKLLDVDYSLVLNNILDQLSTYPEFYYMSPQRLTAHFTKLRSMV